MYEKETTKTEVVVPKFKGYTNRINQVLNECFEAANELEKRGSLFYNVPRPEATCVDKSCEPSDFAGVLDSIEGRVRNLSSLLNSINSHFNELI